MQLLPLDPPLNLPVYWVESATELESLCAAWLEEPFLAIDTEFVRSSTFFPKVGLIQICDGKNAYLIDPTRLESTPDLWISLLQSPKVAKVFHACNEDLEVFQHHFGVIPEPIFDTQLAAGLSGLGFNLGYARLVKALLDEELPKDATRTDWLQRPLSQNQCLYAALDVIHLHQVHCLLSDRLQDQGRLSWAHADCQQLTQDFKVQQSAWESSYRKVKLAWKLNPLELLILKNLSLWREKHARELNVPRSHLVKDVSLWAMAKYKPKTLARLSKTEGLQGKHLKDYGELFLSLIAQSVEQSPDDRPARLPPPLSPSAGDLLKGLKGVVRCSATDLGLAPELLMRKKDYEFIVRSGFKNGLFHLPEHIEHSWRKTIIGDELLDFARAYQKND